MLRLVRGLLILTGVLGAAPVWGQAVQSKEPTSTHIFPAGGRRGTVVPVRVGGECFPPGMTFRLWGDGVSAPSILEKRAKARYEPSPRRLPLDANFINYPKEWESKIEIKPDAPLGTAHWRVTGGWGGTQVRPFLIGDLPEFIETEPNSQPERAERITLPVVVNGQIAGEHDLDFFVFSAKAGEVVVCDVLAARIGSPLDPAVEIRDKQGRRMMVEEVRVGNDPVVAFRVLADGDYLLQVANLGLPGGPEYVYRITVSTMPYVPFAFPPGGKTGETKEVQLFALTGTGTLKIIKEKVTFPRQAGRFWLRSVPFIAGECPEVTNSDDNHIAAKAMELSLPATVNGRFLTADAEDWFRFTAKKGEAFTIDCAPFPPEVSKAIPILAVEDATGKSLAKASGVDGPDRQCHLDWTAPADGTYRIRLRDLQHGSKGGPDFIYRLTIRPVQPDFALSLSANYLNVMQGSRAELDVTVRRAGGFTGPIDLAVTGLPEGVRAEQTRIADNQVSFKLVLVAKDDTRPTDAAVRIFGKATLSGQPRERAAVVPQARGGVDPRRDKPGGSPYQCFQLTVQHKPIFHITCNEAYQYAHRGTIYPYRMQIDRLNGFNGPITLQICDRQVQDLDGIEVVETVIPPGAKDHKNLVYLPESMHASVQHHSRPYAQGYAVFTDKWGQKQAMLAVSDKRCMIRTRPPVVKLRAVDDQLAAKPGATAQVRLRLERTSNFTGAMQVEMIEPAPESGFTAEKVQIGPGQTDAVVTVRMGKTLVRAPDLTLKFRAVGKLSPDTTVVTEAQTSVRFE